MNSLRYKERQKKYLAALLKCNPNEIEYLCDNIEIYYNKRIEVKTNKETGLIKTYSDGTTKTRILRPSYRRLKEIQKAIKTNILAKVILPINIHGGVKKKSNRTNAKAHQGNKYILATDLQKFFPTVTSNQIFSTFLSLGYSNHIAHWLTKLTSCEFELPQGTPTSTHIANLVFFKIDMQLIEFCKKNSLAYTRYVDDLTFSSQKDFRECSNEILSIIKLGGFNINYRKTKYSGKQKITGIHVFPNYIDAPAKIKRMAKQEKLMKLDVKPYSLYLDSIRNTNKNLLKNMAIYNKLLF